MVSFGRLARGGPLRWRSLTVRMREVLLDRVENESS
jgi:hypothetical protein